MSGGAREPGSAGGATLAVQHEPSITAVEHRGIEHVPLASRWGGPANLFWMWAGAVWVRAEGAATEQAT